ncbi:MAG: lipoate--protein ligase family protein [Nitrospiraceae bacterium]|nr:lipoate--protein ligase family protein [Nitrospiraceae bacterium]
MALDEAIALSVRSGSSVPTLRIYGWSRPSLSIGAFQNLSGISIDCCSENNIPIVRRPTGGRAILHGDELTYSFSSANTDIFSGNLSSNYRLIGSAFYQAFRSTGLTVEIRHTKNSGANLTKSPVCFQAISLGEISINGSKIIGSAQKRWQDGFLQQGSIPFSIDRNLASSIFMGRGCSDLRGLKDFFPEFRMDALASSVISGFEQTFSAVLDLSGPTDQELETAAHLAQTKYLSAEHTFRTYPQ